MRIAATVLWLLAAAFRADAAEQMYIVSFHDGTQVSVKDTVYAAVEASGGTIVNKYTIIPAFSARMSPHALEQLRAYAAVKVVEEDIEVNALG